MDSQRHGRYAMQERHQENTPEAKQTIRRFFLSNRTIVLLLLVLVCALGCAVAYYWLQMPRWIDLRIAAPGREWLYVERSTQVWVDSGHRFFIVRKYGYVYPIDGYNTWKSVETYFVEWLSVHGWMPFGDSPMPCNLLLPESTFLDYGENGYLVYRRANAPIYGPAPTVCLAIWPAKPDANGGGYHVVLTTGNPSGLTELLDWMSHSRGY